MTRRIPIARLALPLAGDSLEDALSVRFEHAAWLCVHDTRSSVFLFEPVRGLAEDAVVAVLNGHGCSDLVVATIHEPTLRATTDSGIATWWARSDLPAKILIPMWQRGDLRRATPRDHEPRRRRRGSRRRWRRALSHFTFRPPERALAGGST